METEGFVRPLVSTLLALVQVLPDPVLLGIVRLLIGAILTSPIVDAWDAHGFSPTIGDIPRLIAIDRSHVR